jgi:DNA-binding MarR family transcriptional regulator/N-acetylglutamate synthase-like GNAT family acetyltransferase
MRTRHHRVEAVRRFSRFYTKLIGLLEEGLLESPFSLSEARVIYELAHHEGATATQIADQLGLDAGYLSRVLRRLDRRELLDKRRSSEDRRRVFLRLSPQGRAAFCELDAGSARQIAEILARLDAVEQRRVVEAMQTIEQLLGREDELHELQPAFSLRPHRPGDLGWVVQRHGELYQRSHGWDERFEAMCAGIAARYLERFDPCYERSWVAERSGQRVGFVCLVRRSKTIGQLRFLFVEPTARGHGIGTRLVSECVGHARHAGYRKMTLFTVSGLDAARRLYEAEGFELAHEEVQHQWGGSQVAQRWDLEL